MGKEKETKGRFPCHAWETEDAKEAKESIRGVWVRNYGEETRLGDGTVLHDNYVWDEGNRYLLRCEECGGLVLVQKSECHCLSEDDDYYSDRIPVASLEEADLLNILWGPMDLERYPYRSIRENNSSYFWNQGEKEPRPYDTGELRRKIRKKYAVLAPEQKEMLEKLMEKAGERKDEP